jgi:biofilm PGA synthesis N-glycosyltransferase PgaC
MTRGVRHARTVAHMIALILLLTSGFLVAYSCALYPLVLMLGARFLRRGAPGRRSTDLPFVSVVVAAHNEEAVIEDKIRNTFALDYPKDRLEFLIGSDGSIDRTDEICRRHAWVRFQRIEPRGGKANVLNTLIPKARGEIILLSDANTIIEAGALKKMVQRFDDPTVGGVCGRLVLVSDRAKVMEDTERVYWGYESRIKELESHWHSTVGANGGIYAIRKELYFPIPPDTIIDDFVISMNMLQLGRRLVFEPEAVAREAVSKSFRDEFWRKVRIGGGDLQALVRLAPMFLKTSAFVTFAYVSRKVIRWLMPFFLMVFWASSLRLADQQPFGILFWGLNLSMVLAVVGLLGVSSNRVVRGCAYLYSLNVALILGYGRYLLGLQRGTWQRAQR